MSTADPYLTRYLLGELAESEAAALEREYFEKPDVFARVAEAETALMDDYVRQRLRPPMRQRFEERYLADPRRRARVEFASALATKIDSTEPGGGARSSDSRAWLVRWSLAAALAGLTLSVGLLWLQSGRLRGELARSRTALAVEQQRAQDLEHQLSSAHAQS